MDDLRLGVLLDHLCSEIVSRRGAEPGMKVMVHPQVYRRVAQSRPLEVERGLPLMLLGLELTASESVASSSFRIAR
jgi:hypothetical protein